MSETKQDAIDAATLAAVANFDKLPSAALISIKALRLIASRSPASIWRDVHAGRLPAPVKAGPNSTRWRVGEVRTALARAVGTGGAP